VAVPNVRDYTVADATTALRQAHLRVGADQEQRADPTVAKGKVVGTDPTGTVKRDSQVQLVVSTGPQTVPVPSLQGKSLKDAADVLTSKGLAYRTTQVNSPQDEGTVVDTDPQAAVPVKPGSTVVLKISNARVPVPDVVGQPLAEAQQTLANSVGQFRSPNPRPTPVADPGQNRVVIRVAGVGSDGTAKKGAKLVLVYGQYTPPPPTPTPTQTPTATPSSTPSGSSGSSESSGGSSGPGPGASTSG
jgi:eukaryotic-like serine/threonine-protein kinase